MDGRVIKSALEWVERETAFRTKQSRMLSNGVQGEFLQAFSLMMKPASILEIGTFTGYSTICLSRGLQGGGRIDALELNDELEDIILAGYYKAGLVGKDTGQMAGGSSNGSVADIAHLHIGDAREILPTLDYVYDIVYIDANKREYADYYRLVFEKVRLGGYILADNVLWSGKASLDAPPHDPQTRAIIAFDELIRTDPRVESFILPIRDGIYVIRKS